MERTHRWASRSLKELKRLKALKQEHNQQQEMFGVIQGGPFEDLRVESAKTINGMDFFGICVGGALISRERMIEILDWIYPHLDPEKPRHLLGIGTVPEIFLGVARGMDQFDAVVPTRLARMGHVLYKLRSERGEVRRTQENIAKVYNPERFAFDINKAVFRDDPYQIDESCPCYTCQSYSRAYLHHLFRSRELLVYRLLSIHNLQFMMDLMGQIREAITEKRFEKLKEDWVQ